MRTFEHAEMCESNTIHEDVVQRVRQEMPDEDPVYEVSELFKVFGDSTRARIICALAVSEMCVCDLSALLSMSQSAISHQLRVLKQMDLVKNRREGKTVFYALADDHVRTILGQGLDHITEEESGSAVR